MKKDLVTHVKQKKLFNTVEPIVIALSGGIDSMVLFDVIYKINKNIIIAHVNHNKRPESKLEFDFIKAKAKALNIKFEGYSVKDTGKSNFHEESRNQRYRFFKGIALKYQATKIAVAHHLDDQVETVLMRIVRGTSFAGYSGIKATRSDRNVSIIRPFMDITKNDIKTYAKKNNIQYFEDSSNHEDVYTRNRFRNNIIPLLKKENPNLEQKILQLSEYIESADSLIEEHKTLFLKANVMYNHVNVQTFNQLNNIVKIKVLQHIINVATHDTVEVSYEQYKKMIKLCLSKTPNQTFTLSKEYEFVKEYDVMYIERVKEITPLNITINGLGEYFVDDNKSYLFTMNKIAHNNRNYFELCYNELVFPIQIRHRMNGDTMKIKVGTKKVKDILIDKKIPASRRDRLIIIADNDNVLWIPGVKKSHQDQDLKNKLYIYEVE